MKKIADQGSSKTAHIEDAYVLTARNRFFKRYATLLGLLGLAFVIAAAWATNHFFIEPQRDAALVSKALHKLESTGTGRAQVQRLMRGNASDRVAKTYLLLTPSESELSDRDYIEQYLAALRMAMRAGVPEAKLSYGEALRDGLTGKRDSAAALKIFDEVESEIEPGIRAGDPVAMHVAALMLKKGLGKQPDPEKAIELTKRAVNRLDGWRLESSGYALSFGFDDGLLKGYRDPDLVEKIAIRLIEQKSESGPEIGSFSCVETDIRKRTQCMKGWYERGVKSGIESAIPAYAAYLIETGEPLENVDLWFVRGQAYSDPYHRYRHAVLKAMLATDGRPDLLARAKSPEIIHKSQIAARAILDGVPLAKIKLSPTVNPPKSLEPVSAESRQVLPTVRSQKMAAIAQPADRDPDQQDKTGYLKDQPRSATGGLSTFTVDNRQGGRDAVARIYLNGQKPAVRSMYVKHGETFKAEAILPGTYVFRYRFIGSEDTFESDKSFQLTQTETETGTRYSNVTVTLFKVKDGNMSTRKVDPNSF